jgi:hypothetical protein
MGDQLVHIHILLQKYPVEASTKGRVGVIRKVEVRMVPNRSLKVLNILAYDLHMVKLTI